MARGLAPDELRQAVHDNLDHLGVDVVDVVDLRMPGDAGPVERSLAEPFETLARSPNLLLIPGTSSVAHLEENLQAAARVLGPAEMAELDRIGGTGEPDVDL